MSIETNLQPTSESEARKFTNIHFEPAIHHDTDLLQKNAMEQQVVSNWYEASAWLNKDALLSRMQEYQPKYLFVDGLTPRGIMDQDNVTFDQKLINLWYRLPGPPESFRSDSHVFVIAGDFSSKLNDQQLNTPHDKEFLNRLATESTRDNAQRRFSSLVEFGIATGVGSAIATAIHKALENASYQEETIPNFVVTRRAFIGGLIAATVAISGIGRLAGGAIHTEANAANSNAVWKRNLWLRFHQQVEAIIFTRVEVNARTATSFLKLKDAMIRKNEPEDTPACSVMGTAHSDESLESLESEEHSKKLIFRYLKDAKKILDTLKKEFPQFDDLSAMRTLCSIIADTEVYGVNNPTIEDRRLGWQILLEYIEVTDRFLSPSVVAITEEFIEEMYHIN